MGEIKLCAIYNLWDDWDLLKLSYENIRPMVDGVIIVYSTLSNFGEKSEYDGGFYKDCDIFQCEPIQKLDARTNETNKRNYGLQKALELGYTHFLSCDADEFYDPQEFLREKQRMADSDIAGLVCRVKCYFRSPTLTIGYDTTLVPFIHKLTPTISHEFNRNYPFAWTDEDGKAFTAKRRIRIDPTRSLNISSGVEWSDITMHHYSWVRSDINKKIRNSTARANLERSTIVTDYVNARVGYFCQFYGKHLMESPNVFGLPELNDTSLQPADASQKE